MNQINEKDVDKFSEVEENQITRAVARALIGGGGVYIHIFMLCPTNFF